MLLIYSIFALLLLFNQATILAANGDTSDELDGGGVERLTKSCLNVHASSARPEQLNVTFQLYTKKNLRQPYIFNPNTTRNELIEASPFSPGKPIKWITHGFYTNVDKSEWMVEAKDKILAFEDANVFLTDWRRGASPAMAFYPKAAANAHVVAKMIIKILRRLRNDIRFDHVHLIGHSLGAHIMGFVGSAFTREHLLQQQQLLMLRPSTEGDEFQREPAVTDGSRLIGRITACDPALPCFGPTSSAASSLLLPTPPFQPQQLAVAEINQPSNQMWPTAVGLANINVDTNGADVSSISTKPAEQSQTSSAKITEDNLGANNFADWTPSMWTHLRPDSALVVEVMHSNPGVMGYYEPLGDFDFYPNGFERQPGCGVHQADGSFAATLNEKIAATTNAIRNINKRQLMSSSVVESVLSRGQQQLIVAAAAYPNEHATLSHKIGKFIKPIKEFLHGYTCSHHRAVEYMVESMYYDRIPQHRRLDENLVCQMVGYQCSDYSSFKRGFCFKCFNDHDCRAFTMFGNTIPADSINAADVQSSPSTSSLPLLTSSGAAPEATGFLTQSNFAAALQQPPISKVKRNSDGLLLKNQTSSSSSLTFHVNNTSQLSSSSHKLEGQQSSLKHIKQRVFKRVLPTLKGLYDKNFNRPKGNQYYFDTSPTKDFCLNHYHLFVKYRWLRVRDAVVIDGFTLAGSLGNMTQQTSVTFHRFTHQSYTMLATEHFFLGQINSLTVFGERIKPTLVDYIEVTYMSNLDPAVRALGSARLCRAQSNEEGLSNTETFVSDASPKPPLSQNKLIQPSAMTLFIKCSGNMV